MKASIFIAVALVGLVVIGILLALKKNTGPSVADNRPLYEGPEETNLDLDSAENTLYLDLKDGRVVIQMRPDLAPKHVARIKELVRQGFYDGHVFHRVIDGFMAQTGDPTGTGQGGSGLRLPGEFSRSEKFHRGTLGMARAFDVNSADSQFFITFERASHLDKKYTIWGKVVQGMEYVDAIKKGDAGLNGQVQGEPDKVIRMQIAADASE